LDNIKLNYVIDTLTQQDSIIGRKSLALFLSNKADKGTCWWLLPMAFTPYHPALKLDGSQFIAALKQRLLLINQDDCQFLCSCTKDTVLYSCEDIAFHHFTCSALKHRFQQQRHSVLKHALRVFIKSVFGSNAQLSPSEHTLPVIDISPPNNNPPTTQTTDTTTPPHHNTTPTRLRADLSCVINNIRKFIDVGVANPLSSLHLNNASKTPLAAATAYAALKLTKYRASYPETSNPWVQHIVPFIVEITGALGPDANAFFTFLQEHALQVGIDKSKVSNHWKYFRQTLTFRFQQINSLEEMDSLGLVKPFLETQSDDVAHNGIYPLD
jgi:hypothetical protein